MSCSYLYARYKSLFVEGGMRLICKLRFMIIFDEHPAVGVFSVTALIFFLTFYSRSFF